MRKGEIIVLILVLISFGLAWYFLPQMPERIASHWNARGEVDGYMTKLAGLLILPITLSFMWLLFLLIPRIDPLKANIEKFRKYFDGFIILISLFLFYIYFLMIIWNLGKRFNMSIVLIPAMAVLFFYMGILLSKAKRNWFIGIRTPWTLSSDFVWERTHKIGAKLFKASAILALLGLFFPDQSMIFVLVPIIFSTVFTLIYSYFEFKKEKKL